MPRIPIPVRGIANTIPPRATPGEFTRPDAIQNMEINHATGRIRARRGVVKRFPAQTGGGRPGQDLAVVSRASTVVGFGFGEITELEEWDTRVSDVLVGNLWLLNKNWSMERDRWENVSGTGLYADTGPADNAVHLCRWSPDGTKLAIATNYTDSSGFVVARVTVVDSLYLSNGTAPSPPGYQAVNPVLWSRKYGAGTGVDTRCFDLCWSPGGHYLFAATNELLRVIDPGSGASLALKTMEGWTGSGATRGKCAALGVWTQPGATASYLAGTQFLYVAFNGHSAAGVTFAAAISADHYGSMFRAGVMRYEINTGNAADPLAVTIYGGAIDVANPFFEADHMYFRISERCQDPPYGCYLHGLTVGVDGAVYVARTNQGGGPNSTYPPNGDAAYVTVMKISANGARVWERDTDSIKALQVGGFTGGFSCDFNVAALDYPGDVYTVDPSILAVAADVAPVNNISVYAAGRRAGSDPTDPTEGFNLFRLLQSNGSMSWRKNLSGTLRGVALDPTDNCPVASGDLNDDWDGAFGGAGAGDDRHLWKLSRADGAVIRKYDLNSAGVDALGVAPHPTNGDLAYCGDKR